MKQILTEEDAFSEEKLLATESTLGALAKLCYAHMNGSTVTETDLAGVLSRMPFTQDDTEAISSHRILIEQFSNPASVLQSAGLKASAVAALKKIKQLSESGESKVKILDLPSQQQLFALPL